jgi:hypothetical protein
MWSVVIVPVCWRGREVMDSGGVMRDSESSPILYGDDGYKFGYSVL